MAVVKPSLQITLAPVDYPSAKYVLPHQIRTFSGCFSEIILSIDTLRLTGSRLDADEWNAKLISLTVFCRNELVQLFPDENIIFDPLDYKQETRRQVGSYFFGKPKQVPLKDFRGGPYYSYYYGLYKARNDLVMHLDADMMFHGNAERWMHEALELLKADQSIFACVPLMGPPSREDTMASISIPGHKAYIPRRKYHLPYAYLYNDLSTRAFLLDRRKLKGRARIERPNFDHWVKAIIRGNPPVRFPEGSISSMLRKENWWVLVFLGEDPGLWSLHPRLTEEFKKKLPKVIEAVENDRYPEDQRGKRDVQQSFLDTIDAV